MKQTAKIMENEAKLDLLLKKMEETEHKRDEGENKQSLEMCSFKEVVEAWIPAVEKKVDVLQSTVDLLQTKVEKLASAPASRQATPAPMPDLGASGVRPIDSSGPNGYCATNFSRVEAEGVNTTLTPPSDQCSFGLPYV